MENNLIKHLKQYREKYRYKSCGYSNNSKKGAYRRLFLLLLCLSAAPAVANECSTPNIDESANVLKVHDGDTVGLTDGRKIRLIGIDTPELARYSQPAQPHATAAKTHLLAMLKANKSRVGLVYGKQRTDRYGRQLAHLFSADGTNLQAELLKAGLATAFTVPPNDRLSHCYQQLEQSARCQRRGLWDHARYQLKSATELARDARGFHIIGAKVEATQASHKHFWLALDGNLKVRISQPDLAVFDRQALNRLHGQSIEVRGWLQPRPQGFFMSLRHPSAIRVNKRGNAGKC